ncbi:MAG: hypothetical protein AB8B55_17415 [Mariniblastus sp.]
MLNNSKTSWPAWWAGICTLAAVIFLVQFASREKRGPDRDWQKAMPVSLNGKLPIEDSPMWVEGLENKIWHNANSRNGHVTSVTEFSNSSWKPKNFFDDPLVIELCCAIFQADMAKMSELIEQGAEINKVGKYGMTPLYLAFHLEADPGPFAFLLEKGADPNVVVEFSKSKGSKSVFLPSYAVTHLVLKGTYNRQFKAVFDNGGDPNLIGRTWKGMPAFAELSSRAPDAIERLKYLIDKGANLDFRHPKTNETYVWLLAGEDERRNELALVALEYGKANYQFLYKTPESGVPVAPYAGCYFRLVHKLAMLDLWRDQDTKENPVHFRALVKWLEEHGESFAEAKKDLQRWKQWKEDGREDLIEQEHQRRSKKSTT